MKVTMLLADYAQVAEGKLNVIGGGWTVTGPHPIPSAVAIKIGVPWDQATRPHRLTLRLLDEDGNSVMVQSEVDAPPQPLQIDGQFVADRQNGGTGHPGRRNRGVQLRPVASQAGQPVRVGAGH